MADLSERKNGVSQTGEASTENQFEFYEGQITKKLLDWKFQDLFAIPAILSLMRKKNDSKLMASTHSYFFRFVIRSAGQGDAHTAPS